MPPKTEMITSVSVSDETAKVRFLKRRRSISASSGERSAWRTKNAIAIAPAIIGGSTLTWPTPRKPRDQPLPLPDPPRGARLGEPVEERGEGRRQQRDPEPVEPVPGLGDV